MNKILLPYDTAKSLIEEGDVLLFRGRGIVSYFIGRASESKYTHVGVASWHNGDGGLLECVEFREGKGGRTVNLERVVNDLPDDTIDVYRPIPYWSRWHFNAVRNEAYTVRSEFNGKAVTNAMRKLTGLPYGWKRIWWIAKHKLMGFRLFYNVDDLMVDSLGEVIYPVCSTAIAYAFNKNGFDLINNRSDEWTEPADIAQSARLGYLFTLTP